MNTWFAFFHMQMRCASKRTNAPPVGGRTFIISQMATMTKPKSKARKKNKAKIANSNEPAPALGYFEKADAAAVANSKNFAEEDKKSQDRIKAGVTASAAAYAQTEREVKAGVRIIRNVYTHSYYVRG